MMRKIIVIPLILIALWALPAHPVASDVRLSQATEIGQVAYAVRAVAVGDVDNDGLPDVVASDAQGNVHLWRNSGTPFSAPWDASIFIDAVNGGVQGLRLADLDRDGYLDLAVVDDRGDLSLFHNPSTPFTSSWTRVAFSVGPYPLWSIAVADLDQDGWIDVITGGDRRYGNEILGWRNDGSPFVGSWNPAPIGNPDTNVFALAVADINYNGYPDVAASGLSRDITIWRNDRGPFDGNLWPHSYAGSTAGIVHSLAFADVDWDGDQDLISASETGADDPAVVLWLNDRHDATGDHDPFAGYWSSHVLGASGRQGYALTATDMDRDGDVDIVAGLDGGDGNLFGWTNLARGTSWKNHILDNGAWRIEALVAVDLDADGDLDIIGGTSDHRVLAWENKNAATEWGDWQAYPSPDVTSPFVAVAAGDFNGDSWMDVVTARPKEGIYVWRYDATDTWVQLAGSPLPLASPTDVAVGQIVRLSTADEDFDDIVAVSSTDGIRVWLAHGGQGRTYWREQSAGLPTSGNYATVALGDVNRDGYLDIIAAGISGVEYWAYDPLSSGWQKGPAPDASIIDPTSYCTIALDDLNRDGFLDVVGGQCSSFKEKQGIVIWLGNGGAGWSQVPGPVQTGKIVDVAVGDLNQDGDADIAALREDAICMAWTGDGRGHWSPYSAPQCPGNTRSFDLADYDKDGDLDWVAAGLKGIALFRHESDDRWNEHSQNLPQGDFHFREAAFAHVDHDGILDLMAVEDASGLLMWTAQEPPPTFSNFKPTSWVASRTPDCNVEVRDIGSGLDVSRGAWFQYSTDDGATWSPWRSASIEGAGVEDGTVGPLLLVARAVPFVESTSTQSPNRIRFKMVDLNGNEGVSEAYRVWVDTIPPRNPAQIHATDRQEGECSADTTLAFQWSEGTDDSSGVAGYYWELNRSPQAMGPPHLLGGADTSGTTITVSEDGVYYLHFNTRDVAGNWAEPHHTGPYPIDTQPPGNPVIIPISHELNSWSKENIITVNISADDQGCGVAGFASTWSQNPNAWVGTTINAAGTIISSGPLADGQWYLHIRAVDEAGNASDIERFGPFGIDTTPPSQCSIYSPPETSQPDFQVSWYCQDTTSGIAGYDVQVRWRQDGVWSDWEPWQQATTETHVRFTDAQHLVTYQFRMRATDAAGNESDFVLSGETFVHLPPRITAYSPSTGFPSAGLDQPPLQVVTGTVVMITGTAFAPVDSLQVTFNGEPWRRSHSDVMNDTVIRAMIGANTPTGNGELCVSTRYGEDCAPFQVVEQPFPMRWGLGFDNFMTSSDQMDWGIFEEAFGKCEVNFCGLTLAIGVPVPCEWCPDDLLIPRPMAAAFYGASRGIAQNGDCFGISTLTLDHYYQQLSPSHFASGADIPASLSWETPGLADAIRARQWRQLSAELLSFFSQEIVSYEFLGPLGYLTSRLPWLSPESLGILCIEDNARGHCLNPYDVSVDLDARAARIHVYDNNFPYINNNYPDPSSSCPRQDYLDAALEREIHVTATEWSYGTSPCEPPPWDGSLFPSDYYMLIPYALLSGPQHVPTDILGIDLIFGSDGAGHAMVENSRGEIIGFDATGNFTQTIPVKEAMRITPFMDAPPPFEGFHLTKQGSYRVHMRGARDGVYNLTLWGDGGAALGVQNAEITPASHDTMTIMSEKDSPTGESLFSLTTNDPGKEMSLTLIRHLHDSGEQRTFRMKRLALKHNTPLTVTTMSGANTLILTGSDAADYDICLGNVAPGQPPSEFCWQNIHMKPGARHAFTPEDWNNLNSTRVRLEVDVDNDGVIDETRWLEGHGLALSIDASASVVHPGDIITLTVTYTTTGSEPSPNAVLTATLPMSTTLIDASNNPIQNGRELIWSLGDLEPGASGQEAFTIRILNAPKDAVLGVLAEVSDRTGRWAMANHTLVSPDFRLPRWYLPLMLHH